RVSRAARPDPSAPGEEWASVEVEPVELLPAPVTLERIRRDSALKDFQLLTRSRLSVARVTPAQYARVLALSHQPEAPAAAPKRKRAAAKRPAPRTRRAR
ncbi:MAG TPA: EVE domain-containing protein, partial [Myxococcaceae bacterium]